MSCRQKSGSSCAKWIHFCLQRPLKIYPSGGRNVYSPMVHTLRVKVLVLTSSLNQWSTLILTRKRIESSVVFRDPLAHWHRHEFRFGDFLLNFIACVGMLAHCFYSALLCLASCWHVIKVLANAAQSSSSLSQRNAILNDTPRIYTTLTWRNPVVPSLQLCHCRVPAE